jgi:predicted RNase H-like HicB family nuclease
MVSLQPVTVAYPVVVEREEDGRYFVYVPDLPGCASMGDSYEEAIQNIHEAVTCHLEGLRADGLPVPPALRALHDGRRRGGVSPVASVR